MDIGLLPAEIIRLILAHAARITRPTFSEWKTLLPLVAVSRLWREVGASSVFGQLLITYQSPAAANPETTPGFPCSSIPNDTVIESNLGLISAAGFVKQVRRVNIEMMTLVGMAAFHNSIHKLLNLDTQTWAAVGYLKIHFATRPTAGIFGLGQNAASAKVETRRMACAFARAIPNVKSLLVSASFSNDLCGVFIGGLLSHYAGQLRNYESTITIPTSPDTPLRFSENLQRLKINLGASKESIDPKALVISTRSLRSLKLSGGGLSGETFWNAVCNKAGAGGDIHFKGLQILEFLPGSSQHHARNRIPTHRVHFPELRELYMTSCRASNLLLSSAILPRQLDIFHVCFAEGAIATLVNTRLDVSEWQEIGQCFGQGVVDETNQLFGRLSHKYYSILRITRQMELPNWREIQWAGLCELSIDTAVGMQALVDLVAVLPGLQRLEVLDVDIGSTQPIDFPRDKPHSECAWRGLEPLRTSTSKLRFGYFMSRYTKEDAGAVVMYLMIRMPELKTIMIPERLHEYAHSVKALARWYPHLQHIKTYI